MTSLVTPFFKGYFQCKYPTDAILKYLQIVTEMRMYRTKLKNRGVKVSTEHLIRVSKFGQKFPSVFEDKLNFHKVECTGPHKTF